MSQFLNLYTFHLVYKRVLYPERKQKKRKKAYWFSYLLPFKSLFSNLQRKNEIMHTTRFNWKIQVEKLKCFNTLVRHVVTSTLLFLNCRRRV